MKRKLILITLLAQIILIPTVFSKAPPANYSVVPTFPNTKLPANFSFELKPGQIGKESLTIYNSSDNAIEVHLGAADSRINQEGKTYFENDPTKNTEVGAWISYPSEIITVGPQDNKVVEFEVKIPEKTELKDYMGAITVTGLGEASENQIIISNFRYAVKTYIKVTDNPQPIEKLPLPEPAPFFTPQKIYFFISIVVFLGVAGFYGFKFLKNRKI